MARSLAFGNGTVLICLDRFARVRDIFFPYVGLENHVGGHYAHRIGVWVDGRFSWLDDGSWQIDITCDDTNTGNTRAVSSALGIEITIVDVLQNEKNVFLRKFYILNRSDKDREIRLFFNQQFEIYHSEKGDTAFFDPETNTMIHYEGKRVFLINARHGKKKFDDYTAGIFQIEGK